MFVQDNNNPPANNQVQPAVDQPTTNNNQANQQQDYVASYQPPAQSVQPISPVQEVQPPVKPVTVDEITAPEQVQAVVDEAVGEAAQTTPVEPSMAQPPVQSLQPSESVQPIQPVEQTKPIQTTLPSQGETQPAPTDLLALEELEKMIAEQQSKQTTQGESKSSDVDDQPVIAPAFEPGPKKPVEPTKLETTSPLVTPEEPKSEGEELIAPPPVVPGKLSEPVQSIQPTETDQNQPLKTKKSEAVPEKLEDQNIFFLLGVEDGKSEEKETFLDELQQVIWEDFLENDLNLLITNDEKQAADKISAQANSSDLEKQEKLIEYLAGLIPDLETIMLEKALELKQDMVKERVAGMKEYYKDKPADLAKIDEAAQFFAQGKWMSGAKVLNALV